MRTWSLRKVKSPRVALATALAFGLAGCGGVGTIGDQGPSGTLAQREYNGALYATPQANGKVVLETEEGDGQVLVSWGKLQTGDRLAMGWMGKLYEYSHSGEAKAVQSSAVDEKLVVGGVVQPGASVGLVRFMQGKHEVPAVLTIHSFDAATSKVSYSVTVCAPGDLTCDQPLQPQILQAALNTAISVEQIYKLGFGKDQSQSTSTRLIFGLMRTDGILEGCGGGEGPCGPKPTPTPTPTPTPSPSPSPSPTPTPSPSPSPSPTPTATPTPTPTPEPTTPPAPTSTPKDESDNKGSILPWLLGAAAVGFVAWCWGFDGCKEKDDGSYPYVGGDDWGTDPYPPPTAPSSDTLAVIAAGGGGDKGK